MDQKRPEGADEAFFNWVKQEETTLPNAPEGALKNEVQLGYKFVHDILEILFRQPKGTTENIPYSAKAVRYLLECRAVSSGMVDDGLLPALRLRKDWVGLYSASISNIFANSIPGIYDSRPENRHRHP